MSRDCPLVWPFVWAYGLGGLPRLLRPLLTSRSSSSLSPFRAQGEISPGKNAILLRTTAAFTSPGPWPQELRSRQPARPDRRRLISGSCSSARGLRSTLPSHAQSPLRSCALLASLWPARPGTCTPKIAPMLGALSPAVSLRPPAPPLLPGFASPPSAAWHHHAAFGAANTDIFNAGPAATLMGARRAG